MFKAKQHDSDYESVMIHWQAYGNENHFSRSEDGGQTWKDSGDQAMVFVVGSTEKPNFIQRIFILFKSWFIFLGTAFLFISIFGIDMFKKIFKECKKEFFFSIITVFFLFWLFYFYRDHWRVIAVIVAHILNVMFYFFPVEVSIDAARACPLIQFGSFSGALCGGCSGVESMAIFTAFFLLIVLLKWHRISLLKTTILFDTIGISFFC